MNFDELGKLLSSGALFRFETVLAPRLIPLSYALSLMALLLWAVSHLFYGFESNFGNGLWAILEIAVFGSLAVVLLRIACDMLAVFFRGRNGGTAMASIDRSNSLLDDVREAIHDLAEDDEDRGDDGITPATDPAPYPQRSGARDRKAGGLREADRLQSFRPAPPDRATDPR